MSDFYRKQVLLHDLEVMRLFGKRVATLKWLPTEMRQGMIAALAYVMVESHPGTRPEKFEEYYSAGIDGEYAERHPEKEETS